MSWSYPTYLRFALVSLDPDSHREQGIIVTAHDLRDSGELSKEDRAELADLCAWFNENIPIPKILKMDQHYRAVSWFRPEAKEAIAKMWELTRFLEAHGLTVQVLKSTNPGSIVYSDSLQIVAVSKARSR